MFLTFILLLNNMKISIFVVKSTSNIKSYSSTKEINPKFQKLKLQKTVGLKICKKLPDYI